MIDRDAEIAAMVDEYCPERQRSPAQIRNALRIRANVAGNHYSESLGFVEDLQMAPDETPLDDVLHSGVIGTEE